MSRILRKARGALRNPLRAARILFSEGFHKAFVRLWYGHRNTCSFPLGEKTAVFSTRDWYSKEWFFPRCDGGRYHEPAVTLLVKLLSPNSSSFIDIGAHLGYFSVVAGHLMPEKPVFAVEMDARAFERLETNIARNGLTNVRALHAAITATTGPATYRHLPMLDSGESLSYNGSDDPTAIVPGLTLDDALARERIIPGIIKIDVEGAEMQILSGMKASFTHRPILLLEIHGTKLSAFGADSQQVLTLLAKEGYKVYEICDHRDAQHIALRELTPDTVPFTRNTMTLAVHAHQHESVLAIIAAHGKSAIDAEKAHFNEAAKGQTYGSYEADRWEANPRVREQFAAAHQAITTHVLPYIKDGARIVEAGPGPGTWTVLIANARPQSRFVLIDIAREMLIRARKAVPLSTSLELREGDFLAVPHTPGEAEFFFSSRAFEYMSDKPAVVRRIHALLAKGGRGVIITKMPKSMMNIVSGRTPKALHQTQMAPRKLRALLEAEGFRGIRFFPVTYAVPLLRSALADRLIGKVLSALPFTVVSEFFAESYGVRFRKV